MLSGMIEGGVALFVAIAGGIYIIGQIRENAKRNEQDINDIKAMIKEYQEGITEMISKNLSDMKALLDSNKEHQRDALNREISHIKDLISISSAETREDIKRLQAEQKESNRLKERMVLAEASLKSLHHRLDIDPPIIIKDDNN